ncbi:MAG: Nif11-like leader peptide family natural product precursor [Gloeotrichia echinulata GP01]
MSLQQVNAFYDLLISEPEIYEQYYHKCCSRGFFGICHWDKTKIISFGATLGYSFTEGELDELWFDSDEPSVADQALTLYASG